MITQEMLDKMQFISNFLNENCPCPNCSAKRNKEKSPQSDSADKSSYKLSKNVEFKLWQAGFKKEERKELRVEGDFMAESFETDDIMIVNPDKGFIFIYLRGKERLNAESIIASKRLPIKDLTFEQIMSTIEKLKVL